MGQAHPPAGHQLGGADGVLVVVATQPVGGVFLLREVLEDLHEGQREDARGSPDSALWRTEGAALMPQRALGPLAPDKGTNEAWIPFCCGGRQSPRSWSCSSQEDLYFHFRIGQDLNFSGRPASRAPAMWQALGTQHRRKSLPCLTELPLQWGWQTVHRYTREPHTASDGGRS